MSKARIGVWGTCDGVAQWLSPIFEVEVSFTHAGDNATMHFDRDLELPITKPSLDAVMRIEDIDDPERWVTMPIHGSVMSGNSVTFTRTKTT